jgi:RNA polymerase sigma-70 factor (ECF subfamily)
VEGRPTEDAVLVERSRNGDQDAYGELVTRYQAIAARTAYVITGTAADAEDVAQDAFVKAYYALDRFRSGRPFRPGCSGSSRTRPSTAARRPAGDRRSDSASSRTAPRATRPCHPRRRPSLAKRRELVLDALRNMREEDRLVIAYRYFFDLSEVEMADALGVARGTVKSRLSRAIARLRAAMEGDQLHDA